ncbi:MAG: iron-binding protein [Arcobacteraceae bacterium]|nr:iron-binding protein [Arcobacteraceae bacterium]
MKLNELYQAKHELWLKILFTSFAVSNEKIKSELYEMANMEFRHLKWIGNALVEQNIEFDYEKYAIDIEKETNFEYFEYLISEIQLLMKEYNPDEALSARILSDEFYFITRLEIFLTNKDNDAKITAFNKERIYKEKELTKTSTDALTIFLFDETYKEYELILVYAYMQNFTDNITQYNVYQDLVDESQYHLKCFGNMLAQMGILAIPRTIMQNVYKRDDIKQFLIDGVEEERMAKEECARLAGAVKDDELSKFFDFINFQENYHIELMQKAIEKL